ENDPFKPLVGWTKRSLPTCRPSICHDGHGADASLPALQYSSPRHGPACTKPFAAAIHDPSRVSMIGSRPFGGVRSSTRCLSWRSSGHAPTDAKRLVGVISLTAVIGGTPSPSIQMLVDRRRRRNGFSPPTFFGYRSAVNLREMQVVSRS